MRKMLLPIVLAIVTTAITSLPSVAGYNNKGLRRPYVIEKTCDDDYRNCKVRMRYAPGEHAGLAGPESYWYQSPDENSYGLDEGTFSKTARPPHRDEKDSKSMCAGGPCGTTNDVPPLTP